MQLKHYPISGAISLEVVVSPTSNRVFFTDLAVLRNKKIKYVLIADHLTKTVSGTLPAEGELPTASVTFVNSKNVATIKSLPLNQLFGSYRNGNLILFDQIFEWGKSYVDITPGSVAENRAITFVVFFDDLRVSHPINNNVKTYLSGFEINLTRARNYFPQDLTLSGKRFRNFLLSFPTKLPSGADGIDPNTAFKSFVTLVNSNLQFFQNIPLYLFIQVGVFELIDFENIIFEFTRSFIDVIDPTEDDFKTVLLNCITE